MKKITYLVAPLMVMPFLIGCNKVTTHKVTYAKGMQLEFTTMNGKKLEDSSFNDKQKFEFKVKAVPNPSESLQYTVIPDGIGIYVGNAEYPLFEGYNVEYTKSDKTEAVVTIREDIATADLHIDGIAAKEGNYIWDVPVLAGARLPAGKEHIGWQPIGEPLELSFEGTDDKHPIPDETSFLISPDAENFYYHIEGDSEGWYAKNASSEIVTAADGIQKRKLTIKGTPDVIKDTGFVLIAARCGQTSSFLDSMGWDQIKELSDTHLAKYFLNLNDKKKVSINGHDHYVRIIDFDHDGLANNPGHTAGITFQFETAISDVGGKALKRYWDEDGSNLDFEKSSLYNTLNTEIFSLLPEDLQRNMATVTKGIGKKVDGTWNPLPYSAQLFPLAQVEVETFTDRSYNVDGEGKVYAFFNDEDTEDERRLIRDANGNAVSYWLRSPRKSSNYSLAYYVYPDDYSFTTWDYTSGTISDDGTYVTSQYALAPAFCI